MTNLTKEQQRLLVVKEALTHAQTCVQSGMDAEAEKLFHAVLNLDSKNAAANYGLGLLAKKRQQYSLSLQYFESALQTKLDHGPFWIAVIDSLYLMGNIEEALQILATARLAGLDGEDVDLLEKKLLSHWGGAGTTLEVTETSNCAICPDDGDINSLLTMYAAEELTQCETLAKSLLATFPDHGLIWHIYGATLLRLNRNEPSLAALRRAAALLPQDPQVWNTLGICLRKNNFLRESESAHRRAIDLQNDFFEAYNNLAATLMAQGKFHEAEENLLNALKISPTFADAMLNLGCALKEQGRLDEAKGLLLEAIALEPNRSGLYNNLGNVFFKQGRLSDAEARYLQAIALHPELSKAHVNLGNTRQAQGKIEDAIDCYRRAIEIEPHYAEAFDWLLFVMNCRPNIGEKELYEPYIEYNQLFGVPFHPQWRSHDNIRDATRRLRIGYVSPVFSKHPSFNFLEPLFENHNRESFKIFAFSDVINEDQATLSLKAKTDIWQSIVGLSDDDVAQLIRSYQIDILVDLAGHIGRNRLGVFARKPAPVSLHWLDFGYTTGLQAIDYYLTDLNIVPLGEDSLFSEQPWRLPTTAFVYRPSPEMGVVGPLPAIRNGRITFGSLSRAIRLNPKVIRTWAEILRQVPDSQLVINSSNFYDSDVQKSFIEQFAAFDISPDRLFIGYHSPPWDVLRNIDISLDCFPHNSGTTLFESIYMGVPFITLTGLPGIGRIGCSILKNLGRSEWIADSEEDYIKKAAKLASDIAELSKIRARLRDEISNSALMKESDFARSIEEAYRAMFSVWLESASPEYPYIPKRNISERNDPRYPANIPSIAICHYNAGLDSQRSGNLGNALNNYSTALNICPFFSEAANNLGIVFQQQGQLTIAENILRYALSTKSDYVDALFNLANTLKLQHNHVSAEIYYRKALEIIPQYPDVHYNLGNVLQEQGRIEEAISSLRQALEIRPDHINAFSTLLYTYNYHPFMDLREIFGHYKEFDERYCKQYRDRWPIFTAPSSQTRKIKIGYVAPDYRRHPSRYFIEPLLSCHNRKRFQVHAYVGVSSCESSSDLFFKYVDIWCSTLGLSDEDLFRRIKTDGIDILIDLSGHTAHNRLQVFARKPAPISVHWLDFGYTTGLSAIDYYLTDSISVPKEFDFAFSEQPWRLPTPALAYRPPTDTGDPGPLPALSNGFITFGTLTRAVRINDRTISTWADILHRREGSKLIVNSGSFLDRRMHKPLVDRFATYGIDPQRLLIGCNSPPWNVLRSMDISLDCFPHNSGTTLVESLYMGVPFISLADRPSVGRLGSSLLHAIGRQQWIAVSESEYIEKALLLSNDIDRLSHERMALRSNLRNSPLMDERGFATNVEKAFVEMYERWQAGNPTALKAPDHEPNDMKHLDGAGYHPTHQNRKKNKKQKRLKSNSSSLPPQRDIDRLQQIFSKGDMEQSESLAKLMTAEYPTFGFGHKMLGPILSLRGKTSESLEACQRATALLPNDFGVHFNLGIVLASSGRHQEAIAAYHKALSLSPDSPDILCNLGNSLSAIGKMNESEQHFRKAIQKHPVNPSAYNDLGNTLVKLGKSEEAIDCYAQAIKLKPNFPEVHSNLGNILKDCNRFPEAEVAYRNALKLRPDFPEVLYNLANILRLQSRLDEAIICFEKAVTLLPDFADAYNNMGVCYKEQQRYEPAEQSYLRAIAIRPEFAEAYSNLGSMYTAQARLAEAELSLRKALEIQPNYYRAFSNLLFLLNYHPEKKADEIFGYYREFNERFCLPFKNYWQPFSNAKHSDRRLKIGYVTPQFCRHPVQHFLQPLIEHHNKTQFELFAYVESYKFDDVSQRYQEVMDHWIDTSSLNDDSMAQRIRSDGIDILVDIAGHTGGNRLMVFARKPAPISLHWLDFGYTTGLTAIDYYLTDSATVPVGAENLFSEEPLRLPTPSLVYRPASGMGPVSTLPALKNGFVTFGTLTRAVRINQKSVRVWAEILKSVANSRLVIDSGNFQDLSMRSWLLNLFADQGITSERLVIGFHSPPWDLMREIDIGFDCFPHNSGTTLFEKLYMGIPFITMADRPSVGRLGYSILEGVGHPEWIASSENEYIDRAVRLADDLDSLANLRAGLRMRMISSPLMDETGFAKKVETAYMKIFSRWCEEEQ